MLTPLAATGLGIIMILAMGVQRGGLFIFIVLAGGTTHLLGWFMLAASFMPVGDAVIVLRSMTRTARSGRAGPRLGENPLKQQRVDVHQRGPPQVQAQHRGFGVILVRAGQGAVLAVVQHGVPSHF